eukprot:Rhum_TRINITY_DN14420_c1_g1::Rhum_TRINITY_DN14420_c1_g1_i1::g.89430::m.89430
MGVGFLGHLSAVQQHQVRKLVQGIGIAPVALRRRLHRCFRHHEHPRQPTPEERGANVPQGLLHRVLVPPHLVEDLPQLTEHDAHQKALLRLHLAVVGAVGKCEERRNRDDVGDLPPHRRLVVNGHDAGVHVLGEHHGKVLGLAGVVVLRHHLPVDQAPLIAEAAEHAVEHRRRVRPVPLRVHVDVGELPHALDRLEHVRAHLVVRLPHPAAVLEAHRVDFAVHLLGAPRSPPCPLHLAQGAACLLLRPRAREDVVGKTVVEPRLVHRHGAVHQGLVHVQHDLEPRAPWCIATLHSRPKN